MDAQADGDTLARSQLALLVRLGLLQQDAGEVENDPHAFLNRLPPPTATDALESRSQTSGEGWKPSTTRSPYAPVAPLEYEPVMRVKTRSVTATGVNNDRVPLSPVSAASSGLRRSRFTLASSKPGEISPHELQQRWFRAWKKRAESKRVVEHAHSMARRSAKRRVVSKWQVAVYRARFEVARARQLQCWKAKRVLRRWAAFASLHGRVTWFLTAQGRGFALMNRLRRERAFGRWRRFILWSARQHRFRVKAITYHQCRLQRQWWLAWRVHTFQARRRRVVYRAFFERIRNDQIERGKRWETACELHASHAGDRLRRLLRRWRLFNDARQRDHVHSWQVRMIGLRGKYWTIWYEALCHKRQIETLRRRVCRRIKRENLRAWSTAARAIALGRCSTLWHPEAIRARYLSVWKRWTCDTIRFRIATALVHTRRRRRAVRAMRAWTKVHAHDTRQRRVADAVTRRRILVHVWENGWMVFHATRQAEKTRTRQIMLMTPMRALALWRLSWAVRREWREKKAIAHRMGLRAAFQVVWDAWRRHTERRRIHTQQLNRASKYYEHRLIMAGIMALSSIVDTKSSHAIAARRIRIAQRMGLIRRTLRAWRRHAQRERVLQERLKQFVTSQTNRHSLWNPLRRYWLRWELFSRIRQRLRQLKHGQNMRRQRNLLHAWKRFAFVRSQLKAHLVCREQRCHRTMLSTWRLRIREWRATSEMLKRAHMLFRRRWGSRVLRAWYTQVCERRRRVRCLYEQIHTNHQRILARKTLWCWQMLLAQRQGVERLEFRRRHAWLAFCWSQWHHFHLQQVKARKKIFYFRQIYGPYPATSLFRRVWNRWKSQTVLGVSANNLKRRIEMRIARACFSAWKTFRLVKVGLRHWRTFSVVTSATNDDQGKRIRLFRLKRRLRLTRQIFSAWIRATYSRQIQQEQLAKNRQRMLREIGVAAASRRKRRRCLLRMWLQRWRRRQFVALHAAVCWYRRRLCYKVIRAWWRRVIHQKQERVLEDARRTIEAMSVHSESRLPSRGASGAPKSGITTTRRVAKPKVVNTSDFGEPKAATKRAPSTGAKRMFDPNMYAATYQHRVRVPAQLMRHQERTHRKTSSSPEDGRNQGLSHDPKDLAPLAPVRQRRSPDRSEVDELPLFDNDQGTAVINNTTASTFLEKRNAPLEPGEARDCDPQVSLEALVSMDPYSPAKQPSLHPLHSLLEVQSAQRIRNLEPQRQAEEHINPTWQERTQTPMVLYSPDQSLCQKDDRKPSIRRQPQRKVHVKPAAVQQSLADILDLPVQTHLQQQSAFRAVLEDMKANGNEDRGDAIDVDGAVKSIVGYYISIFRSWPKSDTQSRRSWVAPSGFCMFRDLGLFASGYYVTAMEQAIQRLPNDEHDSERLMRGLLCEFIERHPYCASLATTDGTPSDPLGWLVSDYLTRRLGRSAVTTSTNRPGHPFWIRHELPAEILSSLPKLIKCIIKYQKPLEQFFAWRPPKTASTAPLVDCGTFTQLMKHCNVYPQLFDRREIEHAVECAGARHHHHNSATSQDIQLDFPQFVEAILRCSLRLKWTEEPSEHSDSPSSGADLAVVVKFLMLIFAMEGRGSMLTKRSQDLDVVMQFLQRQQNATAKSTKLRRFQGLLRAESASTKARRTKPKSVFREAMTTHGSHEQSARDDTPLGASADREQIDTFRPTNRYDRTIEEETARFQAQSGAPELSRELQSRIRTKHDKTERAADNNPVPQTAPQRAQTASRQHPDQGMPDVALESPLVGDVSGRDIGDGQLHQKMTAKPLPSGSHSPTNEAHGGGVEDGISEHAATPSQVLTDQVHDLIAPMDRDTFLNEILSSIQDVELLLQQSDVRRSSSHLVAQDTAEQDVGLTSEPFSAAYPERYAVLMNGQLPTGIGCGDCSEAEFLTDDIHVHDPLLDSLTFADRFSESRDWQSQVSIADLAAHGIHAAFPSAMHVRSPLGTSELDDLTNPQRTIAYLREANDEEEISFDELIRFE